MNIEKGVTLEVEIERILPGGLGLAHAEERTIFVSLAAPGDLLRVRIDRQRAKTAFASIVEVLKPSAVRVEPPCPYFGRCGGCDFQHLTYDSQLLAKGEIIRDCLYRIARIENPPVISVVASQREWRYRARANWQVDSKGKRIGYFERGSHEVCDVADCAVLVPALQEALEKVRALFPAQLPDGLCEIEAVAGDNDVSLAPPLASYKRSEVTRKIGSEKYSFGANTFFQINHDLLTELIAAAVADTQGEMALDLYCGVGLFTLPLARRFSRVIGVESDGPAANYARINLANAELKNASTSTARVSEWLKHSGLERGTPDLVLLDPPRTGAEPGVIAGIVSLEPRRISYVSCDPATLARDLKDLLASGYHLASITAFDMFPQTHHVETVVHLGRSEE
ncbi:MAG TPA: class I SAM-dependent RNA methyltransferase [Pyrinomonadaceae bacterium]|nr:class I SAM-dependent RNA methyltransferase [Pyrinomonadaceae bacterium]